MRMATRGTKPSLTELDRIARAVAAQAERHLREDAYQETWLRFTRWPPPNRVYAWREANSARSRLASQESRHQRIKNLGPALLEAGRGNGRHQAKTLERRLYDVLRAANGELVPYDVLLPDIFGGEDRWYRNELKVYVYRLRRKGLKIRCKKGVGYALTSPSAAR